MVLETIKSEIYRKYDSFDEVIVGRDAGGVDKEGAVVEVRRGESDDGNVGRENKRSFDDKRYKLR